MAKINWQDIGELTAVDQNGINKAIIIPAKEALRQIRFALNGNLTLRDNQYAAVITLGYSGNSTQTLTTGVEYTFQNPLKTMPIGFTPIQAMDSNGVAVEIPQCRLNTTRTDGLLGILPWMFSTTAFSGEQYKTVVDSAAPVGSWVSDTAKNITSVTLSPGIWEISAMVGFGGGAVTGSRVRGSISATTGTLGSGFGDNVVGLPVVPLTNQDVIMAIPQFRVLTMNSTTYFLVGLITFTVGTPVAYGRISALRSSLLFNGITGIVTGILWGG